MQVGNYRVIRHRRLDNSPVFALWARAFAELCATGQCSHQIILDGTEQALGLLDSRTMQYVGCLVFSDDEFTRYIHLTYVLTAHRGQKLAGALYKFLRADAKAKKLRFIEGTIAEDNIPAQNAAIRSGRVPKFTTYVEDLRCKHTG